MRIWTNKVNNKQRLIRANRVINKQERRANEVTNTLGRQETHGPLHSKWAFLGQTSRAMGRYCQVRRPGALYHVEL